MNSDNQIHSENEPLPQSTNSADDEKQQEEMKAPLLLK